MNNLNDYPTDLERSEIAEGHADFAHPMYQAIGLTDYGHTMPRDTPEQVQHHIDRILYHRGIPYRVDEKFRSRQLTDMLFEVDGWLKLILQDKFSADLVVSVGYPMGGTVVVLRSKEIREQLTAYDNDTGERLLDIWLRKAGSSDNNGFHLKTARSGTRCLIVTLAEIRRVFGDKAVRSYTPAPELVRRGNLGLSTYAQLKSTGLPRNEIMRLTELVRDGRLNSEQDQTMQPETVTL
ncbi:MAG: hypothetical protein HOE44_08000 [Candidatus Marinimicrobia bacterium]|jgi:hypothetical protein|nr:hypothetical protein [Candidatus Neomarinimicrobiota bacterium]MBT5291035.1 hypothetical protein [Thiotrichales bacterium]MBT7828805.1 hypothetical protein [Candidatus Neomarinimicrobiota bacterium]